MSEEMIDKIRKGALLDVMADILKDNKYEFDFNEESYRIRQPHPKEKQNAYQASMQYHIELLEDPKQKTAKQLKELHKNRGADIDKIDKDILAFEKEKEKYEVELGEMVVKEAPKNDRDALEKKILDLASEITELRTEKIALLRFSIENQTNDYYINYLTHLILEKKIKEENKPYSWERVYKTYSDYEIGDEELISLAALHVSLLVNKNVFSG